MKVRDLIRELQALAICGLGDADVEVQILGRGGRLIRQLVVATERSHNQVPSVLLRGLPHGADIDEDEI